MTNSKPSESDDTKKDDKEEKPGDHPSEQKRREAERRGDKTFEGRGQEKHG